MRSIFLVVAALFTAPCIAQDRVFHASSIDIEQNDRLSAIEVRLSKIECLPDAVKPASPFPAPVKQAIATRKPYAVITIETLPGCHWCDVWKAKEARELRENGWTVIEAPLTSSRSAPYFRICIGDKCYSHSGFMSHSVLRSIIGKTSGSVAGAKRNVVQSTRYTTEQLRSKIRSLRPGGWRGPVYADVSPRSMAKQHLVGPEHGFSWDQVSGLSQEEALILHDLAPRHGNQIFPKP